MTREEEDLFNERFVMDYDNGPPGPMWLHRVDPGGSISIALDTDVKEFINELLARRVAASDQVRP